MEVGTIISLMQAGLSIWDKKLATKYQRQVLELKREYYEISEGEYDKKTGKTWIDRNELDRIRRDIRLLGDLVATEISRSKLSSSNFIALVGLNPLFIALTIFWAV